MLFSALSFSQQYCTRVPRGKVTEPPLRSARDSTLESFLTMRFCPGSVKGNDAETIVKGAVSDV